MLVFLFGKDAYRVKQNTDKIVGDYLGKYQNGIGVLRADLAEENGFAQLEEAVKTVGLFAEKKLIVVKNVFATAEELLTLITRWQLAEDKERIIVVVENGSEAELKKQNKVPTSMLVGIKRNSSEAEYPPALAQGELRKGYSPLTPSSDQPVGRYAAKENKKLFALLTAKPAVSKELAPLNGRSLEHWVAKEAEGLGVMMRAEVIRQLVDYVGNDSWRLSTELSKLANYALAAGDKNISAEQVDLLVTKPLEQNIFNTIDALGEREKGKATVLLARHLADGTDPYYLFSMFVYQFRNLLKVKSTLTGPTVPSVDLIAKHLHLHPFVAKKLVNQCRLFDLNELKHRFLRLAEADIQIKSGQIDIVDCLFQNAVS